MASGFRFRRRKPSASKVGLTASGLGLTQDQGPAFLAQVSVGLGPGI